VRIWSIIARPWRQPVRSYRRAADPSPLAHASEVAGDEGVVDTRCSAVWVVAIGRIKGERVSVF
jgi:hypothetical protein